MNKIKIWCPKSQIYLNSIPVTPNIWIKQTSKKLYLRISPAFLNLSLSSCVGIQFPSGAASRARVHQSTQWACWLECCNNIVPGVAPSRGPDWKWLLHSSVIFAMEMFLCWFRFRSHFFSPAVENRFRSCFFSPAVKKRFRWHFFLLQLKTDLDPAFFLLQLKTDFYPTFFSCS